MSDDGLYGAVCEGSLSGFELQFESEWIDRCPAVGQLAFGPARQDTAGQQPTIGRLGSVVAPRDSSTTADFFGQLAHRVEEVDVVPTQLVDALESGERRCFQTLVAHQAAHHSPILLLDLCRLRDYADERRSWRSVAWGAC